MRSVARAAAAAARRFSSAADASSSGAAAAAADAGAASRAAFLEKLKPLLSSTSAPPSFPSDFMAPKPAVEAGAGVPEKLTLNFFLPHEQPKKGAAVRFFFSSLPVAAQFLFFVVGGKGAAASVARLPL
jgi:F-type H+-transporting ATPase subunit delta